MDIRPLFTERDIQGMSKAFNLGSYDEVKKHAGAIYDSVAENRDVRDVPRFFLNDAPSDIFLF